MRKPPRDRMSPQERRAWRHNRRWIGALLVVWFVVSFVVSWYARELRFDFFGWPFSFWMGAQGALIVYVGMAALYAWRMNRADHEFEPDGHPAATAGADADADADAAPRNAPPTPQRSAGADAA